MIFVIKITFWIKFETTIRVANSLHPDQAPHFVWPDLDQKCLQSQRLPAFTITVVCLLTGQTNLSAKFEIVRIDLQPSEQYKSVGSCIRKRIINLFKLFICPERQNF